MKWEVTGERDDKSGSWRVEAPTIDQAKMKAANAGILISQICRADAHQPARPEPAVAVAEVADVPDVVPEQCVNCGAMIGRLEQSAEWAGHVVCMPCLSRLSPEAVPVVYRTVAAGSSTPGERPVVIEQTAKFYKGWQAIGAVLLLAGLIWAYIAIRERNDVLILVSLCGAALGAVFYTYGRIGAWWHHG
jgi:hypothetical protein